MAKPIIWPRHAWRGKTFEEIEALISNWPKPLQLQWWKEDSRAYRELLPKALASRLRKKNRRPRLHHDLIESVISHNPKVGYATFWPIAKNLFDSQREKFSGIFEVDMAGRKLLMKSLKGSEMKSWPNSKSAFTQLIKRTRERLKK